MPTVSVVIPAHNAADCLGQAIDSVLAQTYADLEIVVVDDGSTDETVCVAESYGQPVLCLRQQRHGVATARNRGIRASSGRYVAFLDADDLWRPEKLEVQLPYLELDPATGLVCSDWALERGGVSVTSSAFSKRAAVASGYLFRRVVRDSFLLTSTVIVRRSCLDEAGYFDESFPTSEDMDLWLRLSYRHPIAVAPVPLTIKREGGGGLSSDRRAATVCRIRLFEKALGNLRNLKTQDRRLICHVLSKNYFDLGYHDFNRMAWKEARGSLLSSLKYQWTRIRALRCLLATYLPVPVVSTIRNVKRVFS